MDNDIVALVNKKSNKLMNDLKSIARNNLSKTLEFEMQKSIKQSIYDKPSSYDRTWSFYDSVNSNIITNDNKISISVFTDPNKMRYNHYAIADSPSYGLSAGDSVDDYISEWLAYGHEGLWAYSPIHNYIDFMYDMLKSNKTHVIQTKNALKGCGYTVK